MRSKKLALLVLALGLVGSLGLAACGGGDNGGGGVSGSVSESNSSENGGAESESDESSAPVGGEEVQGETLADETAWVAAINNTLAQGNATVNYTMTMDERTGEYFMATTGSATAKVADRKIYQSATGRESCYYPSEDGTFIEEDDDFSSEMYIAMVDSMAMEWSRYNTETWDCYPYEGYEGGFTPTVGGLLHSTVGVYLDYFADMYEAFENVDGTYVVEMTENGASGRAELKFVNGLLYSYVMNSVFTQNVDGQVLTETTEISMTITYGKAAVGELPPMTWDGGGDEPSKPDSPDESEPDEECPHSFTEYYPNGDATCTEDGTKTAWCDYGCGETDTVTDEGSGGHSFTDYVSDNNATCSEDGTKTATCDNGCGETDTVTDEGSATGCSYTDYKSNGNATCGEDGTKTATCDNGCGATDEIIDEGSAGHSFTDYVSNNNATCSKDGTKTATCDKGCGETDEIADEYTMRHNYVDGFCDDCGEEEGTAGLIFGLDYNNTRAYVKGYEGTDTRVVIPSVYEGRPVTDIMGGGSNVGNYGFQTNTIIKELVLPSSIIQIGEYAFYGCSNLERMNIPESVTEIPACIFYDCTSLQEIIIPDTVTSIGREAFYGCCNLWGVMIGDGVESIAERAFFGCSSLTSIVIPESVTKITGIVFELGLPLTIYCEANSKPSGWNNSWNELNPVVWNCILNNVADDGYIYRYIDNIRYAVKGRAATVVKQAKNIKTAKFPAEIKWFDEEYIVWGIKESAFYNCEQLTEVEIPDTVKSIGNSAFYNCTSLTKVTIADGVESIGDCVFAYCKALAEVVIPDSVNSIGGNIFMSSSVTSVTVGNVEDVDNYAFELCETLTNINCPTSIIPFIRELQTLKTVTITSGETIDAGAFLGSSSLTEIVLSDTIKSIGEAAFDCCSSLTKIIIPDSVESIGNYAFAACSSLTEIVIPDNVESIGEYAFYGCTNLTIYCAMESQPTTWAADWNPDGCPVYWYRETEPMLNEDGTAYDGDFWKYGENGEIVIWTYTKEE
ncbi:MAG: leucine-rich repeat domain-containing protein [Clostridia bacterium]|nr:leucine-rich repeat domain-containing protein [Clostridia bacterium]